jgi:hypothetical protein
LEDAYVMERIGTKQGWPIPAPDESFMFGDPQEIQDFITAIAEDRSLKRDLRLTSDTVAVLYDAYVSAEDRGREVEIPIAQEL